MVVTGAAFLYLPHSLFAKGSGGGNESTVLDINEETHLLFMRAEEKLAHDVYYLLGEEFPDYAFSNIVDSETNHTDSMIDALAAYSLNDPNTADALGEFAEENFGENFDEILGR
jgi:hypothetical protein